MADFVGHAVIGAGTMAATARALGGKRWQINVAAVYGFVFGSGPDTFDYIGSVFGWCARWEWYSVFHRFEPWWLVWNPPWLLHLVTDLPFHSGPPGWSWWPTYWWLEISVWLAGFSMLWFAYRRTK